MKAETEILVIGTNQPILETVLRLLNANEDWKATGVNTVEEVLQACALKEYQVLLLGAGLSPQEEVFLNDEVKVLLPDIHVIAHYGGGSGLLFAEIYLALGA
ncbi:hypothetical protein [Pedobacter sp. MR2016-24]|uniref:hypothetical protein n=1 Tax=Pedobacter sp. MR2016-24 TaxID=2994466 RepID=UPI0022458D55|nr:hypothetical protein [Pedobacter sp. MR2016-24]MCX2483664.1 hypothetical protein [Pedobacter sp. MR2016-24]